MTPGMATPGTATPGTATPGTATSGTATSGTRIILPTIRCHRRGRSHGGYA